MNGGAIGGNLKYQPGWAKNETENSYEIVIFGKINLKGMDINAEKALLIKEINQVEDITLLRALKYMLHYGLKSEGRISIEQYNRELEEAEAEIDRGEFITHEEFKKQMKGW